MVVNNKVINLLKDKAYFIPGYLLKNHIKLGLNGDSLLIMIYLLNLNNPIECDYSKISEDLGMDKQIIMTLINDLKEKGFIDIELRKNNMSRLEEYIKLDSFYNKIFMLLIDGKEEEKETNIYAVFERELARPLSPIEYELINGWLECKYKEEVILCALKEAIFNGVNSFRYIDRILFEWSKKGIDTKEKVEQNKKEFTKQKVEKEIEVPDYDWLNEQNT